MPTDVRPIAMIANEVVENALAGSVFEFVGRPSRIDVGLVADVVGVEADILFGADVQSQALAIPVWAAANRGPIFPDDITVSEAALPGDRLTIRLRNTTAGVANVRLGVRITPVG